MWLSTYTHKYLCTLLDKNKPASHKWSFTKPFVEGCTRLNDFTCHTQGLIVRSYAPKLHTSTYSTANTPNQDTWAAPEDSYGCSSTLYPLPYFIPKALSCFREYGRHERCNRGAAHLRRAQVSLAPIYCFVVIIGIHIANQYFVVARSSLIPTRHDLSLRPSYSLSFLSTQIQDLIYSTSVLFSKRDQFNSVTTHSRLCRYSISYK